MLAAPRESCRVERRAGRTNRADTRHNRAQRDRADKAGVHGERLARAEDAADLHLRLRGAHRDRNGGGRGREAFRRTDKARERAYAHADKRHNKAVTARRGDRRRGLRAGRALLGRRGVHGCPRDKRGAAQGHPVARWQSLRADGQRERALGACLQFNRQRDTL